MKEIHPKPSDAARSSSPPSPPPPANVPASAKPVERLFPFVLRSRGLIVGRENLWRRRSKLHFILITRDLSATGRAAILKDFAPYPIIQHFTSADLERHFAAPGAKVVGFIKSGLAQSLYAELKSHRINPPTVPPPPRDAAPVPPSGHTVRPAGPSRRRGRP